MSGPTPRSRKRRRLSPDEHENLPLHDRTGLEVNKDPGIPMETLSDDKKTQQRSLFVRSLPATVSSESLTEFFSQSYPIKHATVVVDPKTKESRGYGFVTFADTQDALSAIDHLNGSLLAGRKIKVEMAEPRHREINTTKPLEIAANPRSAASPRNLRGRGVQDPLATKLIIRNLPWTIQEPTQLQKLFQSFGKVKEAIVPRKGPGLSSGFGFVVFRGRKNAERALAAVNGKEVDGRALAVDWAVRRELWEHSQLQENDSRENTVKPETPSSGDGDLENARSSTGSNDQHSSVSEDLDMDAMVDGQVSGTEKTHEGYDKSREQVGLIDDPEDHQSTLFIRNVPFDTDDDHLRQKFEVFGPVRYARVVLDPTAERSRGTAFVCFYNRDNAITCLQEAPKTRAVSTDKDAGASTKAYSLLEDARLDPSGRYTMDGRVLQVSRAVDRGEAQRLTVAADSKRQQRDKDKRRLYLLREGTIPSDSALFTKLTLPEKRMREASERQRLSLIRNNPSLHLSLIRLSVRNIPRHIISKDLKALAREGVIGFAKDIKSNLRQGLSKEELSRGGVGDSEAEKARKAKGKGIVRQAKVVFEGQEGGKVAESSGAGRSRGYGFIEYTSHRWALMGLRWLNGHAIYPDTKPEGSASLPQDYTQGKSKRLIVEFAIENAQVVARRQENQLKTQSRSTTERTVHSQSKQVQSLPEVGTDKPRAPKGKKRKREGYHKSKDSSSTGKSQATAASPSSSQGKIADLAKKQRIVGKKRSIRKARRKNTA